MFTVILAALAVAALTLIVRRFSWHQADYANVLVRDGDSVRITGAKATAECRITGYDAPEWDQPYGTQSTQALKTLLQDGFKWKAVEIDDYGRLVIIVRNAKGSVARQMVMGGHAHNSDRWGMFEFYARITRRGLWRNRNAIHPATYRSIMPKNR